MLETEPITYCQNRAGYRVEKDDDMNPVRIYKTFCPKHQALVDAEDAREEQEDSRTNSDY